MLPFTLTTVGCKFVQRLTRILHRHWYITKSDKHRRPLFLTHYKTLNSGWFRSVKCTNLLEDILPVMIYVCQFWFKRNKCNPVSDILCKMKKEDVYVSINIFSITAFLARLLQFRVCDRRRFSIEHSAPVNSLAHILRIIRHNEFLQDRTNGWFGLDSFPTKSLISIFARYTRYSTFFH